MEKKNFLISIFISFCGIFGIFTAIVCILLLIGNKDIDKLIKILMFAQAIFVITGSCTCFYAIYFLNFKKERNEKKL